ncbi:MAG: hypothetical protein ARM1_0374 [Candidatus Micrarchaeota archaeon]|nr:MAG: hypothetical protein ARM1_0374 [Candidatus Micrarchaeota archaeon]
MITLTGILGSIQAEFLAFGSIAILTVIVVAAFIYMLASFINNGGLKEKMKDAVFNAFASLIMLNLFVFFFNLVNLPIYNAYSAIGLLPTGVNPNLEPILSNCIIGAYSFSTKTITIYNASVCDVAQLYNFGVTSFYGIYYITLATVLFPQIEVAADVFGIGTVSSAFGFFNNITESGLDFLLEIIFFLLLFDALQFIILNASYIIFLLFIAIGLIARIFPFARKFGGGLIALGLTLGLIYPLIASVLYGYVNTAIYQTELSYIINTATSSTSSSAIIATTSNPSLSIFYSIPTIIKILEGLFYIAGLVIAGSSILPLIILAILDGFVKDLSGLFGLQLEIGSLFSGLL